MTRCEVPDILFFFLFVVAVAVVDVDVYIDVDAFRCCTKCLLSGLIWGWMMRVWFEGKERYRLRLRLKFRLRLDLYLVAHRCRAPAAIRRLGARHPTHAA